MDAFFNLHKESELVRIFELFTNRDLAAIKDFAHYYLKYYVNKKFMPGKQVAVHLRTRFGERKRYTGTVEQLYRTRALIRMDDLSHKVNIRFSRLCEPNGVGDMAFEEEESEEERDQRADPQSHRSHGNGTRKKRKRDKHLEEDLLSFDSKKVPFIPRPIYKKEADVLAQTESLSSRGPVWMTRSLFHLPTEKCVWQKKTKKESSKESSTELAKPQNLQEWHVRQLARYQREKEEKYEQQVLQYKKEKKNQTERLWTSQECNLTTHFVFIREGHHAVKWYPQEGESLAFICNAFRDRLMIPSSLSLSFAQDSKHKDPLHVSHASETLLPRARALLGLATLGSDIVKGSLIDIILPHGTCSRWSWDHSFEKIVTKC